MTFPETSIQRLLRLKFGSRGLLKILLIGLFFTVFILAPLRSSKSSDDIKAKDSLIFQNSFLDIPSKLASSGNIFEGRKVRKFPKSDYRYSEINNSEYGRRYKKRQRVAHAEEDSFHGDVTSRPLCRKWGVLTTIFSPPSEAVRRFAYMDQWCLVIVGDRYAQIFLLNIFHD